MIQANVPFSLNITQTPVAIDAQLNLGRSSGGNESDDFWVVYVQVHDAKWSNEIKSNVLTVRILQPEGLNLEALKYIKTLSASSYFFSGVGFSSEAEQRTALEVFTAKFGETLYGDYAAFLLGERYFYDKDYTRADAQFSLLANKADFVFADRAKKYIEKTKKDNALSKETP